MRKVIAGIAALVFISCNNSSKKVPQSPVNDTVKVLGIWKDTSGIRYGVVFRVRGEEEKTSVDGKAFKVASTQYFIPTGDSLGGFVPASFKGATVIWDGNVSIDSLVEKNK